LTKIHDMVNMPPGHAASLGVHGCVCHHGARAACALSVRSAHLLHTPQLLWLAVQGWSDVYFFCGDQLQFCSCNFRWNALGWAKVSASWQQGRLHGCAPPRSFTAHHMAGLLLHAACIRGSVKGSGTGFVPGLWNTRIMHVPSTTQCMAPNVQQAPQHSLHLPLYLPLPYTGSHPVAVCAVVGAGAAAPGHPAGAQRPAARWAAAGSCIAGCHLPLEGLLCALRAYQWPGSGMAHPCTHRVPCDMSVLCLAAAGEDVITRESFISICWRLIPCASHHSWLVTVL
jgi:hypothetical protein